MRCPFSLSRFLPTSRQIQSMGDPRLCSVVNNNVWDRCFDNVHVILNSCRAKRKHRGGKKNGNGIVSEDLPASRRAVTVCSLQACNLHPKLVVIFQKLCICKVSQSTNHLKGINSFSSSDADMHSRWYFYTC